MGGWRTGGLFLSIFLLLAGAASARTEKQRQYLGQTTGTEMPSWAKRAQTLARAEIPADRQGITTPGPAHRGDKQTQILVYQREGRPSYVVAAWRNDEEWSDYEGSTVTVDRVTDAGDLKRAAAIEIGADFINIVEPSGEDVFPDHVPALFVDGSSLSSGFYNYAQHIIRLGDTVQEVTPPLRTAWAEYDHGKLLAMSSDDSWGNFFLSCGQCGPLVPVISEWRDGAFHPACKDHQVLIRKRLASFRRDLRHDQGNGPYYDADNLLNQTLLLLQLGRTDEARKTYQALQRLARTKLSRPSQAAGSASEVDGESTDPDWSKVLDQAITPLFAAMDEYEKYPCPLSAAASALEAGGHPGAEIRANSFR